MGLMGKLFGGGTALTVTLRSTTVLAGGVVAGKVTISGGKKPLEMNAVVVHTYYVHVKAGDGPIPDIDLRKLSETTVATNQALPPGKDVSFEFALQLPDGLDPDGNYKVIATADIPSVKDPKGEADFKVLVGSGKREGVAGLVDKLRGASEEQIIARYPGLLAHDKYQQRTALMDVQCDAYDADQAKELLNLAPWLLRFAKTGPEDLRDEALGTWATLLDGRARPSDIDALQAFAADTTVSLEMRRAVTVAAAKFAEEGALPILEQLARDPDPEVREEVARSLRSDVDERVTERAAMIWTLAHDTDVAVRREAVSGLRSLLPDPRVLELAAHVANTDPSPDVRAAAIGAISFAQYHGGIDFVISTFHAHLASPHQEVREALADNVGMLSEHPHVGHLVHALLSDPSPEVRRKMAWQGINLSEHASLAPMFRHVAEHDPDPEVRADALRGMGGFLSKPEAIAFARQRFQQDPSERMAYAVIGVASGYGFDEEPSAKALLAEMARCQYADAASYARSVAQG